MLQEEGQRVSTACSGFLGPELRWRRRQPVRSLHYHLLPDWEQPPDQLLLNTSHTGPAGVTSLNTAEKEIRVKGKDFLKRKTGSKAKRHSQIIKGGSVYVWGQWLRTDVSGGNKFPRWNEWEETKTSSSCDWIPVCLQCRPMHVVIKWFAKQPTQGTR